MPETRDKNINFKHILSIAFLSVLILFSLACEKASLQKNSNQPTPSPEVKLSAVERDIKSMQTANFEYIFVFRRKDGGVLDGEDKTFLKANSPVDTNRFVLSDDDKAVVAGSSYKFEPQNLEKLGERFNIENYSSVKDSESNVNQANDNKNANKPASNK